MFLCVSMQLESFLSHKKLKKSFKLLVFILEYGYDTTVLKVFFTAAIVALIGSQFLSYFGVLNLNQVYVNEFYVTASIVGGVIMGAGFIMGGFCPGTSFCGAAIGKIDAMVFIGGIVTQNRVHGFCSKRNGHLQNKLWQNWAVNISLWGKRLHFFFLPARKKTKTADSLLTTRNLAVTVVLTLH